MNITGPDFYEARLWVRYLCNIKLIDKETYHHITNLLYSKVGSEEEKIGIEIAEALVYKHPQEFNQYLNKIIDRRICTDYLDITL